MSQTKSQEKFVILRGVVPRLKPRRQIVQSQYCRRIPVLTESRSERDLVAKQLPLLFLQLLLCCSISLPFQELYFHSDYDIQSN